jgi:hypothetical protein
MYQAGQRAARIFDFFIKIQKNQMLEKCKKHGQNRAL